MTAPTRNPFQHPGGPAAVPPSAPEPEEVQDVERVEKPWGHEELFAVLEGEYVGKVLTIRAGQALSLQHHRVKDETLAVESGSVRVELGPDQEHLRTVTLGPGQRLLIRAQTVHRITAVTDSRVLEVSTARSGWREDVVRLADRYGRQGTSAP